MRGDNVDMGYANPAPQQERPEDHTTLAHMESVGEGDEALAHIPEGFKSVDEFLTYAREEFALDLEADKTNREMGLDDLRFAYIDMWDPADREAREKAGRPCIQVNTTPQFIGNVVGDRRLNPTAIRVVPKRGSNVDDAEIRSGIIRSIEKHSDADRVYDAALEDQVGGGIGNFRIALDYADDEGFEQDIFIRQIANPFAVVWDRMSTDPTGKDARRCFVQDIIPRRDYEERWGDKNPIPSDLSGLVGGDCALYKNGWVDKDSVRVTEFWRIKTRPVTMVMMQDGSVQEFKVPMDAANVMVNPTTGNPVTRVVQKKYACMYLITGFSILEGPYELPINRLPIIRVNGREGRVGEERVRFGLIRWMRDPAKMRNYWRSTAVEQLAMAPKNQWLADAESVKGREDDFREAHLTNDPLLIYNKGQNKPERQDPPTLNGAVLQEIAMNTQDIKDTTGVQDANLGIKSNEVSGKALQARMHMGDVATVFYGDNLDAAIQEGGEVINQLLGFVYDTPRTLRWIDKTDQVRMIRTNDPTVTDSIDLKKGTFSVEVITGPSYATQRMYSAEAMLEALKTLPGPLSSALDIIIEEQDWPGAARLAERIKKQLPPELTRDSSKPPSQDEIEKKALQDQQQQLQVTAMQEKAEQETAMFQAELEEKQATTEKIRAQARAAKAEAERAETEAEMAALELEMASRTAAPQVARTVYDLQHAPDPAAGGPQANSGSKPGRQSRRSNMQKRK